MVTQQWRLVGKHSAPPRLFPCLLLTSFLHLCFCIFKVLLIEILLYTAKQIMYVSTPHLHDYFLVSSLLPPYIFVFCIFKILLIEILLYTVRQIMYVSTPQLHDSFPYIRSLLSFLHLCFFACLRYTYLIILFQTYVCNNLAPPLAIPVSSLIHLFCKMYIHFKKYLKH